MKSNRLRSLLLLTAGLLVVDWGVAIAADDEEKPAPSTYRGTWVNKKMRSSGPIECTVQPDEGDEWSARFEGKFKRDPFKYDVKFSAKKNGAKTDLKGSATVDGDPTEWIGSLRGDSMTVRYKSQKGYNGEFTMKKQAAPKAKKKPAKSDG